jgi:virginiamycin A acetyltransferase
VPLSPDIPKPVDGTPSIVFLKPLLKNHPKASAGDYSYFHSFDDPEAFSDNIKYAFDFIEDRLTIGKFCSIAHGANFVLNGGNHFADRLSTYPFPIFGEAFGAPDPGPWPNKGGISIGHDVWIGWDATILPGVSIGHGAIIATKAVVAADVPPYAIVAGNPAKVVKYRLPEADIERMLDLAWWDWPVDRIAAASNALMQQDVVALAAFAKSGD